MLALRYAVTLPRDYDMGKVRDRLAGWAASSDDAEGLLFAAVCLTENGVGEATENSIAPLSVWSNTSRMGAFLWSQHGFGAFVGAFGRPRVETWAVTSIHLNKAAMRAATHGHLVRTADNGTTLPTLAKEHRESAAAAHKGKGNAGAVRGVNLHTGEAVAFDVLSALPRNPAGTVTSLMHVSVPGTDGDR